MHHGAADRRQEHGCLQPIVVSTAGTPKKFVQPVQCLVVAPAIGEDAQNHRIAQDDAHGPATLHRELHNASEQVPGAPSCRMALSGVKDRLQPTQFRLSRSEDDLIPECKGLMGAAAMIQDIMDGECRVLTW